MVFEMMKNGQAILRFLSQRITFLASVSWVVFVCSQVFSYWLWELFSHFLLHYTILFFLAMLLAHGLVRLWWGIWTLFAMVWLIQPVTQSYLYDVKGSSLSVLWYNVHLDNPQALAESQRLIAENADVIALAEINTRHPDWQILRQAYPYGCTFESDSPFALVMWSKHPLHSCQIYMIDQSYPYIRATTTADGHTIALYALHPPPPINAQLAQARQDYLQTVAKHMTYDSNVLAVGDLNSSPFSPIFRQFTRTTHLQAKTHYFIPTWKPFGLNIDHVLFRSYTANDVVAKHLAWQSSDHRPIMVRWY